MSCHLLLYCTVYSIVCISIPSRHYPDCTYFCRRQLHLHIRGTIQVKGIRNVFLISTIRGTNGNYSRHHGNSLRCTLKYMCFFPRQICPNSALSFRINGISIHSSLSQDNINPEVLMLATRPCFPFVYSPKNPVT